MKKKHSPFFTKSKMKHLISDAGHSLPGIFLCALFLCIMTAVTGKYALPGFYWEFHAPDAALHEPQFCC